jgi:hypothetical protein
MLISRALAISRLRRRRDVLKLGGGGAFCECESNVEDGHGRGCFVQPVVGLPPPVFGPLIFSLADYQSRSARAPASLLVVVAAISFKLPLL